MLLLIISYIVSTCLCFLSGFVIYDSLLGIKKRNPLFYIITGLISLSLVSQIIVLFSPVDSYIFYLVSLSVVVLSILNRRKLLSYFRQTKNDILPAGWQPKILLGVLLLLTIIINAGPVIMDDTESYHIQMIKWIREYGSVPGIANLHERYGFNSSWFTSIAFFSFLPGKMSSYTMLNGLVSIWFCYYLVSKGFCRNALPMVKIAVLIALLIALISWPLIRGNAATSNYDSISMLLIVILLIEFITRADASVPIEWLIWPVFLFTVRIINFPILILIWLPVLQFIKNKNWKAVFLSGLFIVLAILPFLIRNIILSGYPLYPSLSFDLFMFDWKTPPEVGEQLLRYIKYFNRVNTGIMSIEETERLNNVQWLVPWFRYMSSFDKLVFIPGIAGIIWLTLTLIKKRKTTTFAPFFLIILIIATTIWIVIAPDPRFFYGYLFTGMFYLFYRLTSYMSWKQSFISVLSVLISFSVLIYSIKKVLEPSYKNFTHPSPLPAPPLKELKLEGITLYLPEKINNNWNARCYGSPLPCLYRLFPGLEPRGNDIKSGFRIKKQN